MAITEGDWKIEKEQNRIVAITPVYKTVLARFEDLTNEESLSNATIMTASKEMLHVIQKAVQWGNRLDVRRGELNAMYVGWQADFEAAIKMAQVVK